MTHHGGGETKIPLFDWWFEITLITAWIFYRLFSPKPKEKKKRKTNKVISVTAKEELPNGY